MKIVIIGAGSLTFSRRLTADILSFERLQDAHIALVDIDEKRLEYAGAIAERIQRDGNYSNATFSTHTDRREALADADAVIISVLVGGFEAIESEMDIPKQYGIDQCIGDTLTPGGIMRCLRTLPLLVEMGQDIMELCPNAWVLNYTNPMAMLCWGMFKAVPGIKLVGLCHSVQGTAGEWAKRLDIPLEDIHYQCAGINHQAWFTRFQHNGTDLLPRMRELCTRQDIWNGDTVRMEYVKHFGYAVTESSGHCSEYSAWWRKRPELIERYCNTTGNDWNGGSSFIKTIYERPDWEENMKKIASGEEEFDLTCSNEYGSRIINALAGGESILIHGNVINHGLIDNVADGALVETACFVDNNGVQPVRHGTLPTHLAAINRTQLNVQELAMEAALTSDPEKVFQAMCLDPLTASACSLDEIRNMTRELMQAHAQWIPAFADSPLAVKPELSFDEKTASEQHIDPSEEH